MINGPRILAEPSQRVKSDGLLDLMYAKAPAWVMQRAVHIHPTVSELIPTVMGDLKPG